MKKMIVLLIGAVISCTISAQVLEENESALVYYSPKTTITLDFEYLEESFEAGIFAEYAEAMLGVTDAVMETSKIYTLKKVSVGTVTTTDYNRPHKVVNDGTFPLLLTINDKGLLTAYNAHPMLPKQAPKAQQECPHHSTQCPPMPKRVAPYPEDMLKAANPRAQALAVAKQIFHLRETRMYLLNGEVEHAPADGEAMKLVLEELNNQEQALTELFIGRKHMRMQHKKVRVQPNNEGKVLFFSEENGFTDGDNIEADTIEVRMICQQQTKQAVVVDPKHKKKEPELTSLVYNIPGSCTVKVLYQGRTLANRAFPVAQLGVDVALPKSMFTGKELPKIIFSEKTGNIVSISK